MNFTNVTSPNEEFMAFVDVETTGLDPEHDLLLEVGCCVVTRDFDWVDNISVVIGWSGLEITQTLRASTDGGNWAREVHNNNGLFNEVVQSDTTLERGQDALIDFVQMWFKSDKPPMGGSSVHFDRSFLHQYMPALNNRFHYRNLDNSSVKEFCRRFNPEVYAKAPEKSQEAHRVLPDLQDTVRECQFYADNFFFQAW